LYTVDCPTDIDALAVAFPPIIVKFPGTAFTGEFKYTATPFTYVVPE
jgi:hypothetical protein